MRNLRFLFLFICVNPSTCSEPTTTLKFTKVVYEVFFWLSIEACAAFSTPATLCRCFNFSQFPPLHFGAAVSFLAISTSAFLTVPLFHVSHFQSSRQNTPLVVLRLCICQRPKVPYLIDPRETMIISSGYHSTGSSKSRTNASTVKNLLSR